MKFWTERLHSDNPGLTIFIKDTTRCVHRMCQLLRWEKLPVWLCWEGSQADQACDGFCDLLAMPAMEERGVDIINTPFLVKIDPFHWNKISWSLLPTLLFQSNITEKIKKPKSSQGCSDWRKFWSRATYELSFFKSPNSNRMAGTAGCQQVSSEQLFEVICCCHGNQALEDIGLIDLLGRGKLCPFVSKFYGGMWQ